MFRTISVAVLMMLTLLAVPARADEGSSFSAGTRPRAEGGRRGVGQTPRTVEIGRRPAALTPLYASLAALQLYDGFASMTGQTGSLGGPGGVTATTGGNVAALWAVKSATTVGTIVVADRLWKRKHRAEAIAVMAVTNGVMAAIAMRHPPR